MGNRYRERDMNRNSINFLNRNVENNQDQYQDQFNDNYQENDQVGDTDRVQGRNMEQQMRDHCNVRQTHVHELLGSVKISEEDRDPHNHRFATVTGEAIPSGSNNHVHDVFFRTDFYENHFHEYRGRTGPAIKVGNRHVHFIESVTSMNDGHRHTFEAATLINNPIGDECRR